MTRRRSIAVLGGTGFVGRRLVTKLHALGHQVTVATRNPAAHRELSVLPGVEIRRVDPYDGAALERMLRDTKADTAVNLVGILNERGRDGRGFEQAHVDLTRHLIGAMQAAGTARLLQMSALNAGRGNSLYLRSRADAEALVTASDRQWSIFQPSVIFGAHDGLLCRFASLLQLTPILPLARATTRFAPVYVDDVAQAFVHALDRRDAIGARFELYGPDVLRLIDIVRMTASVLGLRRLILPLPEPLARLQAALFDFVPGKPYSTDNHRALAFDSVGGIDGLYRLDVTATPIGSRIHEILLAPGSTRRLEAARTTR